MAHVPIFAAAASRTLQHKSPFLPKLFELLESPDWITQINSFMENECVVFDPDVHEHEIYRQVYANYKSLIDKIMYDWRTHFKESVDAVQEAIRDATSQSQTNPITKAMMSQNLQMQLDVMESIQKKTGICPFGAADEGGKRLLLPADDADDALLQEILRTSKEEYDAMQRQIQEEEEAIERALLESEKLAGLLSSQARVSVHDLRALVLEVEGLTIVPEEEENHQSNDAMAPTTSHQISLAPDLDKEHAETFVSAKQFISPEELRRRQEYLRGQRDLLQSKKEALTAPGNKAEIPQVTRPSVTHSTKQIHAKILVETRETSRNVIPNPATEPSSSRKALAEKLKVEVAEHSKV